MTLKERAEKILNIALNTDNLIFNEFGKKQVKQIAASIRDARREVREQARKEYDNLRSIRGKLAYAEGFNACREKAAKICHDYSKEQTIYEIEQRIRQL